MTYFIYDCYEYTELHIAGKNRNKFAPDYIWFEFGEINLHKIEGWTKEEATAISKTMVKHRQLDISVIDEPTLKRLLIANALS